MPGRNPYVLLLTVLVTIAASPVWGAVTINVPADHATIQGALSAADPGDTVLVAAGTYAGPVQVLEEIVLLGAGAGTTIIDGGGATRAVRIAGTSTAATLIRGFTMTGGLAIEGGGVMFEKPATVQNCVISGNVVTGGGANGAGVFVLGGPATLVNCTISGNSSLVGSGGGLARFSSTAALTNCILWDNTPGEISALAGTVTVTYSDVEGGFAGTGNIDADPLFTDAVNGDFTLDCASPCIDAGDPAGTDVGAFEASCVPPTVTVAGVVSATCSGPLVGVTVDLFLEPGVPEGAFLTTVTDDVGAYSFEEVASATSDVEVAYVVPLGYEPQSPIDGRSTITLESDQVVDFEVACLDPSDRHARSRAYWWHQAKVHLIGWHFLARESFQNMATNYPNAIFSHFHENGLNAIVVEDVTYVDNGSGPEPLNLQEIFTTLRCDWFDSNLQKAKAKYLALLLNVASGKLLTSTVVSVDGATASQALQYVADLINDGVASNDLLAMTIAFKINFAQLVGSGVIPLGYDDIAYARRRLAELPLSVFPNPGSATSNYAFSFGMPVTGEATLEIYDVAGRRVATPVASALEAGRQELRWDGRTLDGRRIGQGVYFARLVTPDGSKSVKFVHLAR